MLNKYFTLLILTVLSICLSVPAAAEDTNVIPHEDPANAEQIFNAISLLRYYASSIDLIIQKDETGAVDNLDKMPFANIPDELDTPTSDFETFGKDFTHAFVGLFALWEKENEYIPQYRLADATELYRRITEELPTAHRQLDGINSAVEATGYYLKISSMASSNSLRIFYDEVLAKIQQLYQILAMIEHPLLSESLSNLLLYLKPELTEQQLASLSPEELATLQANLVSEQSHILQPTELTLMISPSSAFVGDEIQYQGALISQGKPMRDREITFLWNSTTSTTTRTDAQGRYRGKFQVPYVYVPEATVETIFYPKDDDTVAYLGAASPVITVNILYYTSQLIINTDGTAYPGRPVILSGNFYDGDAPVSGPRQAEIFLDDLHVKDFMAGTDFQETINIDDETTVGRYVIIITVSAAGRYAPVFSTCLLEVQLAAPILKLDAPRIGIIPGSTGLSGKLFSEIGPLSGATVTITAGKNVMQVNTASDGTFKGDLKMGMAFSLLGTQSVSVDVQPAEPWHAPLTAGKNIFFINIVSVGLIIAILIYFSYFLPRRFRKWFTSARRPVVSPAPVLPAVIQTSNSAIESETKNTDDEKERKANPIIYWYRFALKLVQKITRAIMRPQQTLREYAGEANRLPGTIGKYFIELTYIAERRIYGRKQTDTSDEMKSQQLANLIHRETKHENI